MDSQRLGVLLRNRFQGMMGRDEDLYLFVEECPSLGPLWHWGRGTAISLFLRSLLSDWQNWCRGWFSEARESECIG